MQLITTQKHTQDTNLSTQLHRIIYENIPLTLITVLVNSVILSYIQWDFIHHATIVTWFIAINMVSLIRFVLYKKFQRLKPKKNISLRWKNIALISSITSGVAWGAAAYFLFPADNIAHQVFLAFVLAGMSAGAVTTLSPVLSSLITFISFTMLPLIAQLLMVGSSVTNAMALMAVLFTGMILLTSKRLNRTITESLYIHHKNELSQKIIRHQVNYDELTDLPNRRLLKETINLEIAACEQHGHLDALLFIDLDRFKNINDSLGHTIGDALLQAVAKRLQSRLRNQDSIARIGGDEFIVLISQAGKTIESATKNAEQITQEILQLFSQSFSAIGNTINVTASIGMVVFPLGKTTPEDLLQKSDVAMYEAKYAGRNKMRIFETAMQENIDHKLQIENGLREAINKNQLQMYYQPLMDGHKNMLSVEALIRWIHPEKGVITPINFIDIAENDGLIIPIGDWLLHQACQDLVTLSAYSDLTMCINVSPRQFDEDSFVQKIKHTLEITGANPNRVRLEITENMLISNIESTIEKMFELTALGIRFSIDDFGTGYSSLSYLKRLPVDILKIDKSFVMDINTDANDAIIIETIIAMAKFMEIDVVAEGVENQAIFDSLKKKGCNKFQGFLFSKPMPFDDLVVMINQHSRHTNIRIIK